jgi:hypothetical protein
VNDGHSCWVKLAIGRGRISSDRAEWSTRSLSEGMELLHLLRHPYAGQKCVAGHSSEGQEWIRITAYDCYHYHHAQANIYDAAAGSWIKANT